MKLANTIWGVDLGGTKIEGVVLAGDDPARVIARRRVATEAAKGYGHILGQIESLIATLKKETGVEPQAIGMGTPGTLDSGSGRIKNSNTTCLIGEPLKDDLELRLKLPVRMANDANCFALAEAQLGVGARLYPKAEMVFGIILGTGVGGGIVCRQKIWDGPHGIAGEWGHNVLEGEGDPCYCGKWGCVETVISGPALERFYRLRGGDDLRLPEIVHRARKGSDHLAKLTLERLTSSFGKALSVVVNILDPDLIIVGGGVGQVEELYHQGVQALTKEVMNDRFKVPVVKPDLGDSAGVFGAALLVKNGINGSG